MSDPEHFGDYYGIWDEEEKIWYGDESGPKLFHESLYDLACIAAQMAAMQLGISPTRVRAKLYPEKGPLRLRDTVEPKMTPLEALQRLEDGKEVL